MSLTLFGDVCESYVRDMSQLSQLSQDNNKERRAKYINGLGYYGMSTVRRGLVGGRRVERYLPPRSK